MSTIRHDWTKAEIEALYQKPFLDLLLQAQTLHREHFPANTMQLSKLLNIKTGACPEDCKYCSQSRYNKTGLNKEKLFDVERVVEDAKLAKKNGASRYCMGGAWRSPPDTAMPVLIDMVKQVRALGLETCGTFGMLSDQQADQLKQAGLDYYNHNLDTSPEYYPEVTSTRCYQDRLDTLERVRQAGIKVCCGGILGLGETHDDHVSFLQQLANLEEHPQSVPINHLSPVKGTPAEKVPPVDSFEFIRTIAVARILMPDSYVRLSAGRDRMNKEMQALCFMAGANSIFQGSILLTVGNPEVSDDVELLQSLGIKPIAIVDEEASVA